MAEASWQVNAPAGLTGLHNLSLSENTEKSGRQQTGDLDLPNDQTQNTDTSNEDVTCDFTFYIPDEASDSAVENIVTISTSIENNSNDINEEVKYYYADHQLNSNNVDDHVDNQRNGDDNVDHQRNGDDHVDHQRNGDDHVDHQRNGDDHVDHQRNGDDHVDHQRNGDDHVDHQRNDNGHVDHERIGDNHVDHQRNGDDHVDHQRNGDDHVDHQRNGDDHVDHQRNGDDHVDHQRNGDNHVDHQRNGDNHVDHQRNDNNHVDHQRNGDDHVDSQRNGNNHVDHDSNEHSMTEGRENAEAKEDNTNNTPETEVGKGAEKGEITDEKEEKEWTQEEIQSLLIKAINFKASMKDIKTIIACGADVNKPNKSGLHPLHYASYTDNVDCLTVLINSGANVNVTDDIGYTPLHLASRRGNYRSIEKLIENGALVNFTEPGIEIHQTDEKNKLGYTTTEPLNLAIQNGQKECARLLLEHGARPDNKYFMGYEICLAPLDQPDCLELLLSYGADPNVFNRCGLSPLMKACKDHHIDAVRVLIKYGADVNAQCPPLFEQKSVLQFAINSGNIVIINILLGKGAKFARQGEYRYSALHTAVMKGRADICRLLLQHGADTNERTDEGATALMLACCTPQLSERKDIIKLLIDCGADVNLHSPNYSYFDPYLSPLTEYFKNILDTEGFSIVPLLLRNGAIVHFCSSGIDNELKRLRDPYSILPYAYCMYNHLDVFDMLMNAASKFCPLMIHANQKMPEYMKDILLYTATRPRTLKNQVRFNLRKILSPGLPDKVKKLPLPELLKSYLLFE